MALGSNPIGKSGSISKRLVVAAVAGLVIFIGWLAYHNLFASPVPLTAPPSKSSAESDWVRQKAQESGGDINKLSQQDRIKLMMQTRGEGEKLLKLYAHPQ